jgi:hypothetical protein
VNLIVIPCPPLLPATTISTDAPAAALTEEVMPALCFLSESVSHSDSDQIAGTKILLSQLFHQNYLIPF